MDVEAARRSPINRRTSNVSYEEREVCLLCFCLSKLNPITNSPFSDEFDNFNFLEAHIGYTLPECVCEECLDKLNEIASFINTCKESREKYTKLVDRRKEGTEVKNFKQDETYETVEIVDEVEIVEKSKYLPSRVGEDIGKKEKAEYEISEEQPKVIIEKLTPTVSIKKHTNSVIIEEPNEAVNTEKPTESVIIEEPTEGVNVEEPITTVIMPEAIERVIVKKLPEVSMEIDDIASEHSYAIEEKQPNRRKMKKCPICNESVARYVDHYKKNPLCKPRNVPCSFCSLKFENSAFLYSHQVVHHADKISIVPFVCHLCTQTFKYKGNLQRHLRVHENGKQFLCEQCGRGYTNKIQLEEHAMTHLNIKPYLCNECGKQYSSRKMLYVHARAHKINAEMANESNVCKICKRSFTRRGLKTHMHTHAKNRVYKCSKCGAEFETTKLLRRHVSRTHLRKWDVCPRCSKRVARYTLKQHLRTHSQERPFPCTECSKKFRTKAHLEYHLSALHHTHGSEHHECSYCRKSFASKETLEKHQMNHSSEEEAEKPHKCRVCHKAFASAKTWKRHVARVHGQQQTVCKN